VCEGVLEEARGTGPGLEADIVCVVSPAGQPDENPFHQKASVNNWSMVGLCRYCVGPIYCSAAAIFVVVRTFFLTTSAPFPRRHNQACPSRVECLASDLVGEATARHPKLLWLRHHCHPQLLLRRHHAWKLDLAALQTGFRPDERSVPALDA
jgi:hypothetical protein